MRITGLKKLLQFNSAHIEKAKGTDEQNKTYCSKEAIFLEHGEPTRQGQRTDLQEVANDITSGSTERDIANKYPTHYIRYFRGIREFTRITQPTIRRNTRTAVFVFIGPTRTGKSRLAASLAEKLSKEEPYYKNRSNWWHNYKQNEVVIIDDFYGWLKWDELLKICDRYPYVVETKGSYEEFNSKYIFITSNEKVEKWYKFESYDPAPFLSDRINLIHYTDTNTTKIYHETDIEILNEIKHQK